MADYPFMPSTADVARYVPLRTVPDDGAPGEDDPQGDFGENTTPTADQVARLILDSASVVQSRLGTVPASLTDMARAVTAVRAAGFVELMYPRRDAPINTADQLLRQASADLATLVQAATTDPNSSTMALPVGEFPDPDPYGDVVII